MCTWVVVEGSLVKTIILAEDKPAGPLPWAKYPYPCDLASAENIAGIKITGYDTKGNRKP